MSRNKNTISIVIPSSHNFDDVKRYIHAVLGQTHTPLEIIIDSCGDDKKQLQDMCKNKG
jgi:hypothetical protein